MSLHYTTFNDPVHGTIEMHPLCLQIIDTPEFQRLRFLKQCGICDFVYPSAVHTRFVHSIGVYYLAEKVVEKLKTIAPDKVSEEDALCVKIGALLHDVGHGPFSHLWERFIKRATNEDWKHETMSLKLVDHLIEKNNLKAEFNKYNLGDYHVALIKNIISGDSSSELFKNDPSKQFLLEIVANKRNDIDVDRWEYMMRDAYFFGVTCPLNVDRIFPYLALKEVQGEQRIAFRDKLAGDILKTFECRLELHKICYQHRVCKNLELMLTDALIAADEDFFDNNLRLSNCHTDIDTFLSIDDSLMNRILFSSKKDLSKAQQMLTRIHSRKMYFLLQDFSLKILLPNDDIRHLEKKFSQPPSIELRLCLIDINMGNSCDDLLKGVVFYSKSGEIVQIPSKSSKREIKLLVFSVDQIEEERANEIVEGIKKDLANQLTNCANSY